MCWKSRRLAEYFTPLFQASQQFTFGTPLAGSATAALACSVYFRATRRCVCSPPALVMGAENGPFLPRLSIQSSWGGSTTYMTLPLSLSSFFAAFLPCGAHRPGDLAMGL